MPHLRFNALQLAIPKPPQNMLSLVPSNAKVEGVHGGKPLFPEVCVLQIGYQGIPHEHHIRLHLSCLVNKSVVLVEGQ